MPTHFSRIDWRLLLAAVLFCLAATLTCRLVALQHLSQAYKADLAEITHIRYGLLNAGEWVNKVSAIVNKKIDEFEFNAHNKAELRRTVEHFLDEAIVQVDRIIREKNLADDGPWWVQIGGLLKQLVTDLLVDIKSLRNNVPEFTDLLFDELNRPGGKDRIKQMIHEKLNELAKKTFTPTDYTQYQAVLEKRDCANGIACEAELTDRIGRLSTQIAQQIAWIFILFGATFAVCLPRQPATNPNRLALLLLAASCVALLLGGILTPMIEIDARIAELKFQLLGEPVVFTNQLLYFQSKSITDVVAVLAATGQADMILVGVLISLFSIAFPTAKIAASYLYYQDIKGLRKHPVVRFFTLKSGKWSMADVLVVALFMAYIGFSGLIASQLSNLAQASRYVDVLTTDGTSLQGGFFLFMGFCIASLVLSGILEKAVESVNGREASIDIPVNLALVPNPASEQE